MIVALFTAFRRVKVSKNWINPKIIIGIPQLANTISSTHLSKPAFGMKSKRATTS